MKFEKINNNKKILLIPVIVFVVVLSLAVSTSLAKYKITKSIKLASGTINYSPADFSLMGIYIESDDGYTSVDEVPTEGYEFNSETSYCEKSGVKQDVTINYDMATQTLVIMPMLNKGMKCYLYFDEMPTAAQQIIALAGNGQVFNEGEAGYRYEGLNVDNYVEFNNETWRILAVEEGSKIGLTSGEYYIKLIKEESIGDLAWDTNKKNTWSESSLYNILNGDYLNSTGNYINIGLNNESREQIISAYWYTNGTESPWYTANEFYKFERNDLNNHVKNYIGIIYPSDYGYATPTSLCGSIVLCEYNTNECNTNNWIYKNNIEYWLITYFDFQYYDPLEAWYIGSSGVVTDVGVDDNFAVRPSVYLRSDISFVAGTDGSSGNMFKIAL